MMPARTLQQSAAYLTSCKSLRQLRFCVRRREYSQQVKRGRPDSNLDWRIEQVGCLCQQASVCSTVLLGPADRYCTTTTLVRPRRVRASLVFLHQQSDDPVNSS